MFMILNSHAISALRSIQVMHRDMSTPCIVITSVERQKPGTSASGFMYTAEHSGTHIDALCHQAEDFHLYGNREIDASMQTSQGFTELGVETIAPIIAHGVLLDLARYRSVDRIGARDPIGQDELEAVAQKQSVQIGEGDVVLVRTGNGALWQDPPKYIYKQVG